MTDISFIIPALDEELYIGACLESVHAFAPKGKTYEILVGDNGSTDSTALIVEDFAQRTPDVAVTLHDLTGRSVGGVRNLLAKEASGAYYVFLDADTRVTEEWSVFVSSLLERPHTSFIAGSRVVSPPEDKNNYLWQHWFRYLEGNKPPGSYINSGHMIVPAHVFNALGGFDHNLPTGEDVDICRRAVAHGYMLFIHPELLVYHTGFPQKVKGFFRRELWHGVGDFLTLDTFFDSPPAKAGLAYTLWLLLGPALLLFNPLLVVPWAGFLILVPVGVSFAKEPMLTVRERIHHAYLTSVYLLARGMSFLYRNETRRFVDYR